MTDPFELKDDEFDKAEAETKQDEEKEKAQQKANGYDPGTLLGAHDLGDVDLDNIPPRQWLLANIFCLTFLSSLIGAGASGKTALRIVQALAVAIMRSLTDEHVFRRCRVLYLSLEDNFDEARRRFKAAMLHHKVTQEEVKGWLYIATPKGLRLAEVSRFGTPQIGPLHAALIAEIEKIRPDLVIFDPFIKSHSLGENDNSAIDYVTTLLVELADKYQFAIDAPHHERKAITREVGDADRGRGASSFKDAGRLVYALTPMTDDEAKLLGVTPEERRLLFRVDSTKVNIAPPSTKAVWFRLVGVKLGNASKQYPSGDEVQTVERWYPPDIWQALDREKAMAVLQDIDRGLSNGQRYSSKPQAKPERQAWRVVMRHCPALGEGQCKQAVKVWLENGVMAEEPYPDPVERKERQGLVVKQWPEEGY
jgi:RecA-family ATPase